MFFLGPSLGFQGSLQPSLEGSTQSEFHTSNSSASLQAELEATSRWRNSLAPTFFFFVAGEGARARAEDCQGIQDCVLTGADAPGSNRISSTLSEGFIKTDKYN